MLYPLKGLEFVSLKGTKKFLFDHFTDSKLPLGLFRNVVLPTNSLLGKQQCWVNRLPSLLVWAHYCSPETNTTQRKIFHTPLFQWMITSNLSRANQPLHMLGQFALWVLLQALNWCWVGNYCLVWCLYQQDLCIIFLAQHGLVCGTYC